MLWSTGSKLRCVNGQTSASRVVLATEYVDGNLNGGAGESSASCGSVTI